MHWLLVLLVSIPLGATVPARGPDAGPEDPPGILVRLGGRLGCAVPRGQLLGVLTVWVADREAGSAYAAWCKRQSRGEALYDLVIATTSRSHPWASCPSHVRLGLSEPFPQLRATMLPRDLPYPMKLSEFAYFHENYWLEDTSPVLSSGIPAGPALDFGVEDAGQILLCLGGRWLIGGYH
jgi:hypothetical protein